MACSAVILVALLYVLARHSQYVRFNFDEHQFVASGALLARQGLWPFLDYPFYHLPNLSLIYAGVFQFTDQLLASARLVSATAAWICLSILFVATMKRTGRLPWPARMFIAATVSLAVMATPLFALTSGKAWNQDPALAGAMLALVALWHAAASRRRPGWWGLACGCVLGFAIGTRVTYAPLLIGFMALVPCMPRPKEVRLQAMGGLLAGCALGLLPTIAAWLTDPQTFWYGVLEFPLTNLYAEQADTAAASLIPPSHRALQWHDKVPFIVNSLSHRPTVAVLVAVALLAAPGAMWAWLQRGPGAFALRSASLTAVIIAMGAAAPQPMYAHYLYPALPPLMLCAVLGASLLRRRMPPAFRRAPVTVLAGATCAAVASGMPMLGEMLTVVRDLPPTIPQRIGAWSDEIAAATDATRVLTLCPIIVLEANKEIYEHTAAGPLPYRIVSFLGPLRREQLHLFGPETLDSVLTDDPPPAILTGVTVFPDWEDALVSYAKEHRYRSLPMGDRRILWLAPPTPVASATPANAPLH